MAMRGFALISTKSTENACSVADFSHWNPSSHGRALHEFYESVFHGHQPRITVKWKQWPPPLVAAHDSTNARSIAA